MEAVFLDVLNRSISAGWLILAVCILRLFLRKAQKWISCFLWALVGIRLLCPFTFESVFGLIPGNETVPQTILYDEAPAIQSGISAVNGMVNPLLTAYFAPRETESVNPMQIGIFLAAAAWAAGMLVFFLYGMISYIRLCIRLRTAVLWKENIRQSERIETPFVLGILRPQIYLPFHFKEKDLNYVLAHERVHIRRGDHITKLVASLLLAIFWFHPFCWAAYILFGRDVESACDEAVIRKLDNAGRREYMTALLHFGEKRSVSLTYPLAFGEIGIKERVRNILRYKKPAAVITFAGVVICLAAAVCFLSSPSEGDREGRKTESETDGGKTQTQTGGQTQAGQQAAEEAFAIVQIPVTPPMLTPDMITGADGAMLDYEGDWIVFHGYFGLFVYDLESRQLMAAVDLKEIGCDATQGDNACEVAVSGDGSKIYLRPLAVDFMYVYDLGENTMLQKPDDISGAELYSLEEAQGYLTSEDETLSKLKYKKGDTEYLLFEKLWQQLQEQLQMTVLHQLEINRESVTSSGMSFTIHNYGGEEVTAGDSYKLRRRQEGVWVDVEYILDNWAFNSIGYPIAPGDSREMTVDWSWLYGALEPGSYCFYTHIVMGSGENLQSETLEGVFEIE